MPLRGEALLSASTERVTFIREFGFCRLDWILTDELRDACILCADIWWKVVIGRNGVGA